MAVNEFLECATALSFMLAEEYNDGGLQMYHKIDLKDFEDSTHFKNFSAVYVLEKLSGFNVKTCVGKLKQDCYSVEIIIIQRYFETEIIWPVEIEWKASLIREGTEECLQLKNEIVELKELGEEQRDRELCFSFQVTKAEVQDFIKDDKICFKWTINILKQKKLNEKTFPTVDTSESPIHSNDYKRQLNDILSKIHTFGESLNSSKSREDLECMAKAVSDCENTKKRVRMIEDEVNQINKRMKIITDKFVEQRKRMEQSISDWNSLQLKNNAPVKSSRKEKSCVRLKGEKKRVQETKLITQAVKWDLKQSQIRKNINKCEESDAGVLNPPMPRKRRSLHGSIKKRIQTPAVDSANNIAYSLRSQRAKLLLFSRRASKKSGLDTTIGLSVTDSSSGVLQELGGGLKVSLPATNTASLVSPSGVTKSFFGKRMWGSIGSIESTAISSETEAESHIVTRSSRDRSPKRESGTKRKRLERHFADTLHNLDVDLHN